MTGSPNFYESNLSELVRVGMYSLKNGMRIVPTNENLKKMVKYMRKNDYERAFAILKKDHFMQGKDSANERRTEKRSNFHL